MWQMRKVLVVAPASVRLWGRGSRVHAAVSEGLGETTRCLLLAFPILLVSSWIALASTALQTKGREKPTLVVNTDWIPCHKSCPLEEDILRFPWSDYPGGLCCQGKEMLALGLHGSGKVDRGIRGCAGSCTFLRALLGHKGFPHRPLQNEEASMF